MLESVPTRVRPWRRNTELERPRLRSCEGERSAWDRRSCERSDEVTRDGGRRDRERSPYTSPGMSAAEMSFIPSEKSRRRLIWAKDSPRGRDKIDGWWPSSASLLDA